MKRKILLHLWIILSLSTLVPAQTTITVGQGGGYDYNTIQAAIDAATAGDTVLVYSGTYHENIHFLGKNIILRSNDPTDADIVAATVIDGNARDSAITFSGTEDETCVLAGLTICNGYDFNGAGISGNGARAAIEHNVIVGNRAAFSGGGIYFCHGAIQNNAIMGNTAAQHFGGGLYECNGTIQDNEITGNAASYAGGGLFWCNGKIQNNTITSNAAGTGGGGLYKCVGAIQCNTISGNYSRYGGGLYECDGVILNNTIAYNSATEGGGLYQCRGTIRNCIIWENSAPAGAQLDRSSTPSYSCIQNGFGEGVGNISDDPQLTDPMRGDFHLQAGSPCIDAGANGFWWLWPQRDLDGNCRVFGSRIDMGCYEYGSSSDSDGDLLADTDEVSSGTDPLVADTDGDGLRDGLEVFRGSDPLVPTSPDRFRIPRDIPTIQQALAVSVDGDEIVVSPGVYRGNIQFCGANVILRSEVPEDAATVAATILDGGGVGGAVVSFQGGESEECVLVGFTIQNGVAKWGAGICGPTRAAVRSNTISRNAAVDDGGGLYQCNGTIQNNIITSNTAHRGGGLYRCHATIQNNTITDNAASWGGGLYMCPGTIQDNAITNNTARDYGGGLHYCGGTIQNNTIRGNTADRGGGGLYCCDGTIQNNTIRGNTADRGGGGLYYCDGTVQNNTICGNTANGYYGGGLYSCGGLIQNNTITSNSAREGGGLYLCNGIIHNCIIWQNSGLTGAQLERCSTPSYSCIQDWSDGGEGRRNISDDPQLADPANGDFHLLPMSPCIDAGRKVRLTVDFEGDPRPFDYTAQVRGDGSDFDIGADEALRKMELTTAANPAGAGRVVPAGTTRHYFTRTVTVTAIPSCGWAFERWSGGATGTSNPIAIVMDTDKTVTAHFVAMPGADLEGRLDGMSPYTIIVGHPLSLQGDVSNAGNQASTSTFWVEFWVHNKQTGWRGLLCDSIKIGPMAAGESFDLAGITPPRVAYENIPAGTYAIEMRIDVLGEVAESCEANNIARWEPVVILPDRPNLVVAVFDFAPQDVGTSGGDAIRFYGHVRNTGSQPTSGSFWVEFHVCADLPFRFAGHYLCDSYKITAALAPGESIDLATLAGRVTYALAPGVYYVGMRLDPLDEIAEQRGDDNGTWLPRKKLYVGPRPTGTPRWTLYR